MKTKELPKQGTKGWKGIAQGLVRIHLSQTWNVSLNQLLHNRSFFTSSSLKHFACTIDDRNFLELSISLETLCTTFNLYSIHYIVYTYNLYLCLWWCSSIAHNVTLHFSATGNPSCVPCFLAQKSCFLALTVALKNAWLLRMSFNQKQKWTAQGENNWTLFSNRKTVKYVKLLRST